MSKWKGINLTYDINPQKMLENYRVTMDNKLSYHFSHISIGELVGLSLSTQATNDVLTYSSSSLAWYNTNTLTLSAIRASSAIIGQIGSTGSIDANIILATVGSITTLNGTSATYTKLYASSAHLGNSTSYTMTEDDGTIVFVGDARTFRDELGDITKLRVVGTAITEDTTDACVLYSTQSALTSFQYCNVQLNHDRDLSGGIYPHIHWIQTASNAPNFLLGYRYLPTNSTIETAWTYLKCNTLATTYSTGSLHQISYTTQAITPPANSTVSDIIQFKIYRDVANASTVFSSTDNYAVSAKVLSFDAHIITNTIGSRTEFSK